MPSPKHLWVAFLFVLACNQSDPPKNKADAGSDPGDALSVSLPDLPPGCPPASGNDVGIGKPCTATGNECSGSLQCSCKNWFGFTMPAGMPCFCTSVSFGPACSACGSQATCCTYDNVPLNATTMLTISACFPSVCAPNDQCPGITP